MSIEKDIHKVLTLKEAAQILGVAPSTLRTRILNGEFNSDEYRKTDGTIILSKSAVEARKDTFRIRIPKNNLK